jgi:anti-sigma regulatory factor (Ser/Thr protein kinase)
MFQADVPAVGRVFDGEPRLVSAARRWAAALLAEAGADQEVTALLTSELFTNTLLHTRSGQPGGTVTVLVTPDGELHVHDHGPLAGRCGGPGAWTVAPERASFGQGMVLVARLSAGLVHGPAAACPLMWPGDPASSAGGCCTRCFPPALEAAPEGAADPEEQRQPHPAAA